jgi:hypothetical protein
MNMKKIIMTLAAALGAISTQAQTMQQAQEALDLGNMQKANMMFNAIYKANPNDINNVLQLGNYYALAGNKDSAKILFEIASKMDTKSPLKAIAQARIY